MEVLENFRKVKDWHTQGKECALATVIWKQGSALRSTGAKMAISSEMEMAGSVSGGCVEGAVVQEALGVMASGEQKILEFGIADETAWTVGLACGGSIKVLIQDIFSEQNDFLNLGVIKRMMDLLGDRKLFSLITVTDGSNTGEISLLCEGRCIYPGKAPEWLDEGIIRNAMKMERTESSQLIHLENMEIFVDVHAPEPRLIVVGAVHIAVPLTKIAQTAGFYTIVVDPRKAFNTRERFSHTNQRLLQWPKEALKAINLNKDDYLVLLTHDDKLDLPALEAGIDKNAKYIGMLNSRTARDKRYKKMEKAGYSREQLEKVHCPVGLDIGAKSQEEIALSILAEITAARYGKL